MFCSTCGFCLGKINPMNSDHEAYTVMTSQKDLITLKETTPLEKTSCNIECLDFVPGRAKTETATIGYKPQAFPVMVDRANMWLKANPSARVITCQTVDFKSTEGGNVDPLRSEYRTSGIHPNHFIRAFRMWVKSVEAPNKDHDDSLEAEPDQIGYLNVVPTFQLEKTSSLCEAEAETIDEAVDKTNSILRLEPLPGRMITAETINIMCGHTLDPDRMIWTDRDYANQKIVTVIRIYYVLVGTVAKKCLTSADVASSGSK